MRRDIAHRLFQVESGKNPNAISAAGAIGLGQLMPGTARELGVDPHDPAQNIAGSMRYFKQGLDKFGGDYPQAIMAYNAGPNNKAVVTKNWSMTPKETKGYWQKFSDLIITPANADETPYQAPTGLKFTPDSEASAHKAPNNLKFTPDSEARAPNNLKFTPEGQPQGGEPIGIGESTLRGAGQGVTLGFQDEGSAALQAGMESVHNMFNPDSQIDPGLSLSDRYAQNRDNFRKQNADAEKANPGHYLAGNIAGGIVLPMGKVNTFKDVAKVGAAFGAANAAGSSEANNAVDLAKDTVAGTILGTGTSLGGKVVGEAVAAPVKKLWSGAGKALTTETPELQRATLAGIPVAPIDRLARSEVPGAKTVSKVVNDYGDTTHLRELQRDALKQKTSEFAHKLNPLEEDAPVKVIDSLNETLKGKKSLASRLYDDVDAIAKTAGAPKVALENTSKAVRSMLKNTDVLNRFPDSRIEAFVKDISKDPTPISFAGVRDLRSRVGDYLRRGAKSAGQVGDADLHYLGEVKTALEKDLERWSETSGSKDIYDAYKMADTYYRVAIGPYKSKANNAAGYLTKVNKGELHPENVMNEVLGGRGGTQTKTYVNAMKPEGIQFAQSEVLNRAIDAGTNADGIYVPSKVSAEIDKILGTKGVEGGKASALFGGGRAGVTGGGITPHMGSMKPDNLAELKVIRHINNDMGRAIREVYNDPKTGNRWVQMMASLPGVSAGGLTAGALIGGPVGAGIGIGALSGVALDQMTGRIVKQLLTNPKYTPILVKAKMATTEKAMKKVTDEVLRQFIKAEPFQKSHKKNPE